MPGVRPVRAGLLASGTAALAAYPAGAAARVVGCSCPADQAPRAGGSMAGRWPAAGWVAATRLCGFADSVTAQGPEGSHCAHNWTVRRDRIRHGRVVAARVLVSCAVTLAVIALAPVIVLVGEPLRRYYLRRLSRPALRLRPAEVLSGVGLRRGVLRRAARRGPPVTGQARAGLGDGTWSPRYGVGWRQRGVARVIIANPVLIALTAPGRWAMDRVGGLSSGGSGRRGLGRRGGQGGGNWPPPAGVREPRRPKPAAPAGAIALAEPRQQRRAIPILKAVPPVLSEPARRVGSRLGRMAGVLRARVSHWLTQMREYRRRGLRASGS